MTKPPDGIRSANDAAEPYDQFLRNEMLRDMSGGECISLSHIDSVVAYGHPSEPLAARQSRVTTTITSLLTGGLLLIGDIVGGGDDYVDPWELPTEGALARLRELYVTNHGNKPGWGWVVWFALTPEGEQAAQELATKGDAS